MPKRSVPLIYVIVVAVTGPTLGIILTFGYVVAASRGQRAATCSTVAASRAEKMAQLQAYEETPPTTEAGENLREKTRQSLETWDRLWVTLGCKEAADGR